MRLERLFLRLRDRGVPPSLLIDLYDTPGMERALEAELAEVEAKRTLEETTVVDEAAADKRTA